MAHQYATTAETRANFVTTIDDANTAQIATLTAILQGVSAAIDQYTKRPAGYFLARSGDATVRRMRGNGENFLKLGRYVISEPVAIDGFTSDLFYKADNGWLYATDVAASGPGGNYPGANQGDGLDRGWNPITLFEKNAVYLVSAKWGFAAIPDDIKVSCQLFAQHIWDRGQGTFGQVTPTGFIIERDMPPTVRLILDGWVRGEFELN